jgi:hypothetical protein
MMLEVLLVKNPGCDRHQQINDCHELGESLVFGICLCVPLHRCDEENLKKLHLLL